MKAKGLSLWSVTQQEPLAANFLQCFLAGMMTWQLQTRLSRHVYAGSVIKILELH